MSTTSDRSILTEQEEADYKERFDSYDLNGDGMITAKELGTMERSLGMTPTEKHLDDEVNTVDTNKNGGIDYDEFISVMARKKEEDLKKEEAKYTKAFNAFDEDENGFIDEDELKYAMNDLLHKNKTDKEIKDMFIEADVDKDGQIDFPEFVKMARDYSSENARSHTQAAYNVVGIDTNSGFYQKGFEVGIVGLIIMVLICAIVKVYNHFRYKKSKIYHALAVINATEEIEIGDNVAQNNNDEEENKQFI